MTVRSFHINSEECLKYMEIYLNGVKLVSHVLRKVKGLINVKYEDLYESSGINRKVIEKSSEIVNIHDLGRIYKSIKKTPVKYTDVLLNHNELLNFFKGSQFDMWLSMYSSPSLCSIESSRFYSIDR
jgi:hypothetical protein